MRHLFVLFVVCTLLALHGSFACDPSKGCDDKASMCIKVKSFVSKCTKVGAKLGTLAGYCDVNHQDVCDKDQRCNVPKGRCVHFCDPDCANGEKCQKVYFGSSSAYKCVSKDKPCGGACENGASCVMNRLCMKVPSGIKDISKILAKMAGSSLDTLGGFFTTGKKLDQKDMSKAQPGDVVTVSSSDTIIPGDHVALDARGSSPDSEVNIKMPNVSPADEAEAKTEPPTDSTDGTSVTDKGELTDLDALPDATAAPSTAEEEVPPPADEAAADNTADNTADVPADNTEAPAENTDTTTQSTLQLQHALRRQSRSLVKTQNFVNGLKTFFITDIRKIIAQTLMAVADSTALLYDACVVVLKKCQTPINTILAIFSSGGSVYEMLMSSGAGGGVRLQADEKPSGVAFPTQFTGPGALLGSFTLKFHGNCTVVKNEEVLHKTGVQSLRNATVELDDAVSVNEGVVLAANGTVVSTGDNSRFIIQKNAVMRFTGYRFGARLHLQPESLFNLTMRGARLDRVRVGSNAIFRVATHSVSSFAEHPTIPGKKQAQLVDKDAISVDHIDSCDANGKLVFHLKKGYVDDLADLSGPMLKFRTPLTPAELANFKCTIVLEDEAGNQKELQTNTGGPASTQAFRRLRLQARTEATIRADGISLSYQQDLPGNDQTDPNNSAKPSGQEASAPAAKSSPALPAIAGGIAVAALAAGAAFYLYKRRRDAKYTEQVDAVEMSQKRTQSQEPHAPSRQNSARSPRGARQSSQSSRGAAPSSSPRSSNGARAIAPPSPRGGSQVRGPSPRPPSQQPYPSPRHVQQPGY